MISYHGIEIRIVGLFLFGDGNFIGIVAAFDDIPLRAHFNESPVIAGDIVPVNQADFGERKSLYNAPRNIIRALFCLLVIAFKAERPAANFSEASLFGYIPVFYIGDRPKSDLSS